MPNMKVSSPCFLSSLTILAAIVSPHGSKDFIDQFEKWNYREGAGRVNLLGTRSITGTLEKWAKEIFTDGKDILMYQPQLLLPEYTGIRSLSEALDDILRDVTSLKKRLVELNERLDAINRVFIRKRLRMAPRNPSTYPRQVSGFLQRRQMKLTQHPQRPFPLRRRVYIRRRKVKA